jgi:hypothetical protein
MPAQRIRNEWFRFVPEMLAIDIMLPDPPKPPKSATAEVARQLGVSLQVVSNMKSRGIPRSRLFELYMLASKEAAAPRIVAGRMKLLSGTLNTS